MTVSDHVEPTPLPSRPTRTVDFLIAGMARSGTTLCQRLASELAHVAVPRETHFWSNYLQRGSSAPQRWMDRAAIVALLDAMCRPDGQMAMTEAERERVCASSVVDGCTAWELFGAVVDALSPDGAAVLGEKTPAHAWSAAHLLAHEPSLRLVAVVRDPRANFASLLGVQWGQRDAQRFAWRWRLLHERLLAERDAFGHHRILIVRYEDLVTEPDRFQNDLASFLGVDDERSPAPESLFLPHETWKQRALQAPDVGRIDSWRQMLAVPDVAVVEQITAPVAERFDYRFDPGERYSIDPVALLAERRLVAGFDIARRAPVGASSPSSPGPVEPGDHGSGGPEGER